MKLWMEMESYGEMADLNGFAGFLTSSQPASRNSKISVAWISLKCCRSFAVWFIFWDPCRIFTKFTCYLYFPPNGTSCIFHIILVWQMIEEVNDASRCSWLQVSKVLFAPKPRKMWKATIHTGLCTILLPLVVLRSVITTPQMPR